jgi:outer membrane protein OmpA-like peptidoglycan-associated protein
MVGVNSSESRLYHLFSDKKVPAGTLAQPLVLDRLAFEPGQARLGAEAAQQLGNVAALLHTFPKVRLQLSGHAAPTEPKAWSLPAARAQACLAELIKRGVAPARLHTAPAAPKAGDPNPQGLSIRVVAR